MKILAIDTSTTHSSCAVMEDNNIVGDYSINQSMSHNEILLVMVDEMLKKLNIDMPEMIVRATDNISDMEEYVKKIIENGFAYETEDTIYFDTSKLDKYGVLSNINIEQQKEGARVEQDINKKNKTDFAIWIKAPKEHIMKWDSFFRTIISRMAFRM